jgi:flagellar biosynthesis regulator FlbT
MDAKTLDIANAMTLMIENGQKYDSLYCDLKKLKEEGFSKEQVYEALEIIRTKYIKENNEEKEDTVLELMDIASNYCSPHQRIWDLVE